jgi:hypothetical protein
MDQSLEEIRERVKLFLMDVGGLIWDNPTLDESIRQAMRDLQVVTPITLTLEGLDGALVTMLEMGMDGLIVRGAAVYALEMRMIDRADTFELNQTGLDMSNLVEKIKTQYLIDVQKIRTRQFQMSPSVPYFTLPDPDKV